MAGSYGSTNLVHSNFIWNHFSATALIIQEQGNDIEGVLAINEKIAETDAKQGRNDKRVLTVLVAAIALCLIAFGAVEFFQETVETAS